MEALHSEPGEIHSLYNGGMKRTETDGSHLCGGCGLTMTGGMVEEGRKSRTPLALFGSVFCVTPPFFLDFIPLF